MSHQSLTKNLKVYPTTTEEDRTEFRKIAKRQWTMLVHGWIKPPLLQFEYFERVKENINPNEYVRFTATVIALRKGTEEQVKFEREAFAFEPFENQEN